MPSVAMLPEEEATVILSVLPLLTAKLASTSTVLLNSVTPVTVNWAPSVTLLSTLRVEFNSV